MPELKLRIKFQPLADSQCFRRTVTNVATGEEVESSDIRLSGRLFPNFSQTQGKDLHQLPAPDFKKAGHEVFEIALGPEGARSIKDARKRRESVSISVFESPDHPLVSSFPWELMHDGDYFLSAHPKFQIERRPEDIHPVAGYKKDTPLRMLVFWAAPDQADRLEIEIEQSRIGYALAPHKLSGRVFETEIIRCTRSKLSQALADANYDILYFTGHGTINDGEGEMLLEKEDGSKDPLRPRRADRIHGGPAFPPLSQLLPKRQ